MDVLATASLPIGSNRPSFTLRTCNETDQIASSVRRAGWESVETPLPRFLYRVARRTSGLVIDVGANTGFYTLLAASASARNRVLAFEPVPSILELLHRNVRDNELQERVRLIRCALSDRNGMSNLFIPAQDHGLVETSASLHSDFKQQRQATTIPVLLRTLDRVLLRPSLVAQRVTLIKIDVEGHEASVIAGARWTIRRHRPVIFVEVLQGADTAGLTAFLRRSRYADVRLYPDRPPVVKDHVAFDEAGWNHALVPQQELFGFLAPA